ECGLKRCSMFFRPRGISPEISSIETWSSKRCPVSWPRGYLVNTNDFASLLWILKMSRQNGVVHVELPKAGRTEMGEMWRAHLYLAEGHVAACQVLSLVDGRRLLSDEEALRWLTGWGQRELAWSLEVFTQHKTAPRPAPADPLPRLSP